MGSFATYRWYFGNIVYARPLCGGNALRKCKGEFGFRILAMFFSQVTKCYPMLLIQKLPFSPLAVSQPGTQAHRHAVDGRKTGMRPTRARTRRIDTPDGHTPHRSRADARAILQNSRQLLRAVRCTLESSHFLKCQCVLATAKVCNILPGVRLVRWVNRRLIRVPAVYSDKNDAMN